MVGRGRLLPNKAEAILQAQEDSQHLWPDTIIFMHKVISTTTVTALMDTHIGTSVETAASTQE
jgi:hypothetical protein